MRSSPQSWTSAGTSLVPDFGRHPELGFEAGQKHGPEALAVVLEGRFDSAWQGKDSPLLAAAPANGAGAPQAAATQAASAPQAASAAASAPAGLQAAGRVIDHSPASARLVVIGAPALFSDQAMRMIGQALGGAYRKPAEFALNLVDWALEDPALLGIRSRGRVARTLEPMPAGREAAWEYGNYALALAGLGVVALVHGQRRKQATRRYEAMLREV
jgi:ABC-2 type transport system permease protein